jgi:multiple sugar transport system permease protein
MKNKSSVLTLSGQGRRSAPAAKEKLLGKAVLRRLSRVEPYLYLLPAVLAVAFWIYRPLLQTLKLSFYQWNLLPASPKTFVGMQNYERILTLPDMKIAIVNSLIYMVGILPFSLVLPLVIAISTDRIAKQARNLYRMLVFLPMIMAPVVVSVIWNWILHPTNGIVNHKLQAWFGIVEPVRFFTDSRLAIWSILFITGWKMIGFSTLIFSSALTGINREYYEAAAVDRASLWQIVRHITLPLLSPYIIFILMLSILFSSEWSFAYINVLTQGGPANSTMNIYYLLWNYGFKTFAIGWSSAAAVLFFIVFGLIAWMMTKLSRRYSFYDH